MSLPIKYNDHMEYFQSSLEFLYEYSWIYRTANTRFLKDDILDKMPKEWIEYFLKISLNDLNDFPLRKLYNLPNSLQLFYNKLIDLTPNQNNHQITTNLNIENHLENLNNSKLFYKCMGMKKNHEIINLSNVIYKFCTDDNSEITENIDIFIDIGCGLGYLSQILFEKYHNINILCIDSSENNIKNAIKRQQKYYPLSNNYVNFVQHKITNESGQFILDQIEKFYSKKFNKNESLNLCIIGLHTCADLFTTIINLYYKLKNARKLICMPCCYHKFELYNMNEMKQKEKLKENSFDEHLTIFKQFPISKEFIRACNKFQKKNCNIDLKEILNRPFLRLACQQTSSRWKNMNENDHKKHGKEMFIRGIVDYLLTDNINEYIVKIKNNLNLNSSGENMNDTLSFDEIENNYEIRSKLSGNNCRIDWNDNHRELFSKIISKYSNGDKLAEGLTCLQTALQEFCENLVLLDRMCYMNNLSDKNQIRMSTKLYKIMDDSISPRCYAILSKKLN